MKKNLYIANLLVAGLMTFTGCTDGFESDIWGIKRSDLFVGRANDVKRFAVQ